MNNENYTSINGINYEYDYAYSELIFYTTETNAADFLEETYTVYDNNGGNYEWTVQMQIGSSEQNE